MMPNKRQSEDKQVNEIRRIADDLYEVKRIQTLLPNYPSGNMRNALQTLIASYLDAEPVTPQSEVVRLKQEVEALNSELVQKDEKIDQLYSGVETVIEHHVEYSLQSRKAVILALCCFALGVSVTIYLSIV